MSIQHGRPALLAGALCLFLCPVLIGRAEEVKPPQAMDQLKAMSTHLASLNQFTVKINSGYDVVQKDSRKIEYLEERNVSVLRPSHIRFDVMDSEGDEAVFTMDGSVVTGYSASANAYATTQTKATIDEAITHMVDDLKMRIPLIRMYSSTFPQQMAQLVESADLVETRTLGGVPSAHISARMKEVDLQVWVPLKGEPLPTRVVLTYKNEPQAPQFWAQFSEWNTSPNLSEDKFRFTPPAGAEQVNFGVPQPGAQTPARLLKGERK